MALRVLFSKQEIIQKVRALASMLSKNQDIKKTIAAKEFPLCLGILDAAFVFMADLTRSLSFPCEITFIKATSYQGTKRKTLSIDHEMSPDKIRGKVVILLDTIIDTGHTIRAVSTLLQKMKAKMIIPVCLLYKPTVYQYKKQLPIRYKGFAIPNHFVVGYGLDWEGKYRALPDIYEL